MACARTGSTFSGQAGRWASVLVLLAFLGFGGQGLPSALPAAIAQNAGEGGEGRPVLGSGRVRLEGVRLGVGDRVRPGSWAGVLVQFQNRGERELEVLLRVETPDADGDRVLFERVVTANPGVRQSAWVYTRVPHPVIQGAGLLVSVHEALEAPLGETPTGFRAGELYDRQAVVPTQTGLVSPGAAMIGIVGRFPLGLTTLGERLNESGADTLPQGHERTELVGQLRPQDLPDRWMGLESFHTLVWAGEPPSELRSDAAEAIAEWVTRGGHLVVVLPAVGQEWVTRGGNELFDLLPRVRVRRMDDVSYEAFRPLLTADGSVELPSRGTVHVLEPDAGAEPGEGRIVLAGPSGEGLVARRHLGAGAVTLIGLDLNDAMFRRAGLAEVGAFWNRVLGRRGQADPNWRLAEIAKTGLVFQRSDTIYLDDAIGEEIAKTGRAAAGVLLGVVVFALYWAIAGPVGYAVLKGVRRTRYAWVAFLATAGVFTAIAWGGATALRPKTPSIEHLTVLTHVHGQPVQRARTWVSLLIPDYGSAHVRVGREGETMTIRDRRLRLHQAMAPWEARSVESRAGGGFPDTRAYAIESRAPESARIPARQTVKQLRADWAGATEWGLMPRVPTGEDGRAGALIASSALDAAPWQVDGELVHELPGELRDVRIIVVKAQTTATGLSGDRLLANAGAFALRDPWSPGVRLNLSEVTGRGAIAEVRTQRNAQSASEFLDVLTPQGGGLRALPGTVQVPLDRRLMALALYGHLRPPELVPVRGPAQLVALRSEMHGLDLSRWFTEPCVIVLGTVVQRGEGAGGSPVPILVDGQAARANGRTLVAWVYPLPDDPPRLRGVDEGGEAGAAPGTNPASAPGVAPGVAVPPAPAGGGSEF
mgnify:CR=1 FL=1